METRLTEADASADPSPAPDAGRATRGRDRLRPGAPEREGLRWWLLSRLAVLWVAAQAVWVFPRGDGPVPGYLARWFTWDAQHYVKIARYGYDGPPGDDTPLEAFFPGLPLLLRLVHAVVRDWAAAGLLISFVAGAVAVAALARLAADEWGPRAGGRAALLFCVCPLTVFLTAGYTEALFLAFAIPAWIHARRGRWAAACLLAAGAACVRVTGLFLAAALVVEFVSAYLPQRLRTRHPTPATTPARRLRAAPWLLVPFVPVVGYFGYLYARTGDWGYWFHAQKVGWYREYTGFTATFHTTWDAAFGSGYDAGWRWAFRAELLAVAIGVVLVVALAVRLRYAEAVYVAASLLALTTSTWYFAVARTSLLWWPLWTWLAVLAVHPRHGTLVTRLYLFLSAPLAALLVAAFTTWRWAG
jgi:hypothetical protein